MKRLPATLLVAVALPAAAIRPVSPSVNTADYNALSAQIAAGRALVESVALLDASIRAEEANVSPNAMTLRSLKNLRAGQARLRNYEMTRAIRLAMRVYDIPYPSGTSTHLRNHGESVNYIPVFDSDLLEHYTVATRTSAARTPPTDPLDPDRPYARTFLNGASVFRQVPDEPRELALLLIHESTHAKQFTGAIGRNDAEYDARKAALDAFLLVGYTSQDQSRYDAHAAYVRKAHDVSFLRRLLAGRTGTYFGGGTGGGELAGRSELDLRPEELAHIREEAARLRDGVVAEDQRRAQAALAPIPAAVAADSALAPAGPTAPPVSIVPLPAREAPSGLNPASLAPLPARDPNYIVAAGIAWSACSGDWNAVAARLPAYGRLTAADLPLLEGSLAAETDYCRRSMLQRLIDSWRAGRTLDVPSLQNEVQAIRNPPPVYDEPVERTRRREPCTKRGVYYPQCGEDG